MATALNVSISYFYEGFDSVPAPQTGPDKGAAALLAQLLESRAGADLAYAFVRIRDPEVQRRLVHLAHSLGEDEAGPQA